MLSLCIFCFFRGILPCEGVDCNGQIQLYLSRHIQHRFRNGMYRAYVQAAAGYGRIRILSGSVRYGNSQAQITFEGVPYSGAPFHSMLRHEYATSLYRSGVDIKTAQRLLGHSDIKITLQIYTHLEETSEEVVGVVIEKMDGLSN